MQRIASAAFAGLAFSFIGLLISGCLPVPLAEPAVPEPPRRSSQGVELGVQLPPGHSGDIVFSARPVHPRGEDFTIVVLPDTQHYADRYPETFMAQTRWIAEQRQARNIVAVLHLGDIVDDASQPHQWAAADAAIAVLERDPNLPFGLAVGNHDQWPRGNPAGTQQFNAVFPVERFAGRPWYGGHYGDDNDNHAILFSGGGLDFIAVFLEFARGGDPETLAWADAVLTAHADRHAIIVTHFALTSHLLNNRLSPQGRAIRDALSHHPNFFLMLGGHFCGAGRRTDVYPATTVHSVLSDYQCRPNGGDGFLRLIEISPAAGTMRFRSYSPTRDEYLVNPKQDFALPLNLPLDAPFVEIGRAVPDASGRAAITWTPPAPGGEHANEYEWRVATADGIPLGGPWTIPGASGADPP